MATTLPQVLPFALAPAGSGATTPTILTPPAPPVWFHFKRVGQSVLAVVRNPSTGQPIGGRVSGTVLAVQQGVADPTPRYLVQVVGANPLQQVVPAAPQAVWVAATDVE